jgi:hypothetical protein
MLQGSSNADGVQSIVADGADDRRNIESAGGEMRAHLPTGRMGIGCRKQAGKELTNGHAARQHQCLVAIMQMQPVVVLKEFVEKRRGLVAGARNMEMCYALLDEFSLKAIYFSGNEKYSMKLLKVFCCKPPFHLNDFPDLSSELNAGELGKPPASLFQYTLNDKIISV